MTDQSKDYPLISVIVPTYNNEASIARTLESIIAQDYPNIEIIVVNDASTDRTVERIQDALKKNRRPFTLISHKARLGVSSARNTGMDAARGDYIWFCDSDDLAEEKFVSTLTGLASEYNCDASFCGMKDRFDDGRPDVEWPILLNAPYMRSGGDLVLLRTLKKIVPGIWCVLFRKRFLDEKRLRFYDGCRRGEDVEFQLKAFCRARTVAFTPECLYIYMHHSTMTSSHTVNTEGKQLDLYSESVDTSFRVAEYLCKHAPSEKVKDLSENLLLAEAIERRATLCAKTGDRAAFGALLADEATRKRLKLSWKYLFKKPEVCLKAFALLYFQNLYYRLRTNNSYGEEKD